MLETYQLEQLIAFAEYKTLSRAAADKTAPQHLS